jgi:hypothetical protein
VEREERGRGRLNEAGVVRVREASSPLYSRVAGMPPCGFMLWQAPSTPSTPCLSSTQRPDHPQRPQRRAFPHLNALTTLNALNALNA